MKKLTAKWKIYLIANYIQLAAFTLTFIFLIYGIFAYNSDRVTGRVIAYQLLLAAGLLAVSLNSSFNIHVVHKYFPDTLIPSGYKTTIKVFAFINVLFFIGLLFLSIFGLREELRDKEQDEFDDVALVLLIIMFFFWIIGTFILILQFQSFGYLKRNYAAKMSTLIDSIGNN